MEVPPPRIRDPFVNLPPRRPGEGVAPRWEARYARYTREGDTLCASSLTTIAARLLTYYLVTCLGPLVLLTYCEWGRKSGTPAGKIGDVLNFAQEVSES